MRRSRKRYGKEQKEKALKSRTFIAGEEGIEPPLTVLETAALPLYYSPMNMCQTTDESYCSICYSGLARENSKFL